MALFLCGNWDRNWNWNWDRNWDWDWDWDGVGLRTRCLLAGYRSLGTAHSSPARPWVLKIHRKACLDLRVPSLQRMSTPPRSSACSCPRPCFAFPVPVNVSEARNVSRYADSNRRPTHYECVALPTELYRLGANWRFHSKRTTGGADKNTEFQFLLFALQINFSAACRIRFSR